MSLGELRDALIADGYVIVRTKQWHSGESLYVTIAGSREDMEKASRKYNGVKVEMPNGDVVDVLITRRA